MQETLIMENLIMDESGMMGLSMGRNMNIIGMNNREIRNSMIIKNTMVSVILSMIWSVQGGMNMNPITLRLMIRWILSIISVNLIVQDLNHVRRVRLSVTRIMSFIAQRDPFPVNMKIEA